MKRIFLFLLISCYFNSLWAQSSDDEFFEKGRTYGIKGEYKKSIEFFQKSIDHNPNNANAYFNLGCSYNNLEQYQDAIYSFQKSIKINPSFAEAYYGLGYAYFYQKKYNESINACLEVIVLKPDYSMAYFLMGYTYKELNDYHKSIEFFKKGNEIKPRCFIYRIIGLAYHHLEQYDDAISAYQEALKNNCVEPSIYDDIGLSYNALGEYEEAIKAYKEVIQINPTNAKAFRAIGNAYENLGKHKCAITFFKKAIELNPEMFAYSLIGDAYKELKKYPEAIDAYQEAIKLGIDASDTRLNLQIAKGKFNERLKKQEEEKRLAIIIGNADYKQICPSSKSVNDAYDMAKILNSLKFTVNLQINVDYEKMNQLMSDMEKSTEDYDIVLFYYSGHSAQYNGKNYLLPINISDKKIIKNSINVEDIINKLQSKMKIIVLDASRNNELNNKGLSKIEISNFNYEWGTLIDCAANYYETEIDSAINKRNSIYTRELLNVLEEDPNLNITEILKEVRNNVFEKTNKKQRPVTYGDISKEFFFRP